MIDASDGLYTPGKSGIVASNGCATNRQLVANSMIVIEI